MYRVLSILDSNTNPDHGEVILLALHTPLQNIEKGTETFVMTTSGMAILAVVCNLLQVILLLMIRSQRNGCMLSVSASLMYKMVAHRNNMETSPRPIYYSGTKECGGRQWRRHRNSEQASAPTRLFVHRENSEKPSGYEVT
jgi:hypothetical protein